MTCVLPCHQKAMTAQRELLGDRLAAGLRTLTPLT